VASNAVVGTLKALLTMDSASFDAGAKKASASTQKLQTELGGLGKEVAKLTPQAERMVKAFGGDKLLHSANNLTQAVTKLGGASKLTEAEQARVNRTLNDAITKYTALGQQAPKAMLDLEQATRKAGFETKTLSAHMVALSAAAGVFAAQLAGQAIRTLINFGKEAVDTAGTLLDLSAQTGLSTDTLQRMDLVASHTGKTLETFTDAAFKLGVRLSGGGDSVKSAVRDLGLEWEKLKTASPDKQFELTIAALGRMTDAGERNRIGQELFGKAWKAISAGVVQNYEEVAKAAQLSSRAQLEALDIAGDRWDQFVKNTKANIRSLLGDVLLAGDEIKRSSFMQLLGAAASASLTGSLPDTFQVLANINKRNIDADAKRKATADDAAKAREQQTKKEIDYVAALKSAQGELKNIDAAERKQIAAMREMGADTDDIVERLVKYGASGANAETVLKLLSETTKKTGKAAADAGKEWQSFIDRFTNASVMETALDLGKAIGTGQIKLAKLTEEAQQAITKALDEGAEAWKAWGGVVPAQIAKALDAVNAFKHSVLTLPGLTPDGTGFKSLIDLPEPSISDIGGQLEQFERIGRLQVDAARDHAKAIRDLDLSRTDFSIKQAEREGAKKVDILRMQSVLAQRQRDADLQDAEDAFEERTKGLHRETADGAAEYNIRLQEYQDHVTKINETWAQGQAEREAMIRRESSFWASELGKRIGDELRGIQQDATGHLFSTLFAGVDDQTKKQAKAAKEDYERIKNSGRASAEEITRAFRAMRDAEEASHSGFANKFKGMWDSIKRHIFNIFDDILGHFVNNFLKGLLNSFMGTGFGQKLGGMFGKLLGFGGGGSGAGGVATDIGGGLLGKIPGLGGLFGGATAGAGILGAADAPSLASLLGAAPGGAAAAGGGSVAAGVSGASAVLGKVAPIIGAATGIIGLFKNRGLAGNLLNGVTAGASIGTLVLPGIGTAIGAGLGAIAGGLRSVFGGGADRAHSFVGHRLENIQAQMRAAAMPSMNAVAAVNPPSNDAFAHAMGGARVIHNHTWNVRAWDSKDFQQNFKGRILPAFKQATDINDGGIATTIQKAALQG